MTLAVVRIEPVPVEEIRAGDRVVLPSGVRVTAERIDEYDGLFFVRWWRPAARNEPGHPGAKDRRFQVNGEYDGRYLGSLIGVPAGHCWTVDRG